MKRRKLTTQTILAVACFAAGCGADEMRPASVPTTDERPAAAPNAAATPIAVTPVVVTPLAAAPLPAQPAPSPEVLPVSATSEPSSVTPPKVSQALHNLQGELYNSTQKEALQRAGHFRPLCDKDGFPLVGNAQRKATPEYTVAQFCADIRKAKH